MIRLSGLISRSAFGRVNEAEGDLLDLVGKDKDDDLTMADARTIGKEIAEMEGDKLQSYLGMVKALGGYYGGQGEGKETLDKLRKAIMKSYNEAKGNDEQNESVNESMYGLKAIRRSMLDAGLSGETMETIIANARKSSEGAKQLAQQLMRNLRHQLPTSVEDLDVQTWITQLRMANESVNEQKTSMKSLINEVSKERVEDIIKSAGVSERDMDWVIHVYTDEEGFHDVVGELKNAGIQLWDFEWAGRYGMITPRL